MKEFSKKIMHFYLLVKFKIKWLPFDTVLFFRSINNPGFFFIQIGSCDGVGGDPIRRHIIKRHWSGVLVEPVKYLFEKLIENYKNEKKLIFDNSAISEEKGVRNFYRLTQSNDSLPAWYDQLGSFSIDNVLKHKEYIPDIENRILVEQVPTITLAGLIEKYSITKIDLLHIDAEGYDYEILKQIKFIHIKPRMILFENAHLIPSDLKASEDFLRENGYFIIRIEEDTFAFRYRGDR